MAMSNDCEAIVTLLKPVPLGSAVVLFNGVHETAESELSTIPKSCLKEGLEAAIMNCPLSSIATAV